MTFLELKEQFENKLTGNHKFDLLELHFAPYSFGSGIAAYRLKGGILKIIYEGRDNEVQLLISSPHNKYPNCSWATIFTGLPGDFIDSGITTLISLYGQSA